MDSAVHELFEVADRSYFALIKKRVHSLAVEAGLTAHRTGETDIVVSELLTNLIKHAGEGKLLVKQVQANGLTGLELIAVDDGPGMNDFSRMIADGSSSKNTLGLGLGSISRIANEFKVFSNKGWGTVMLIRIWPEKALKPWPGGAEIRSIVCAKHGETACGDGFFSFTDKNAVRLFLGDGLGHGPDAQKAVQAAGQVFLQMQSVDPVEIIRTINQEVKKTRGLVGTVSIFDRKAQAWRFCGVGNITTKIYGPSVSKNLVPYNGIIGLNIPRTLNEQIVPAEKGQLVLGSSDGLKSRADMHRFPSLFRADLSLLCATLIKDYARHTDDMSVMACKINQME